MSLPFTSVVSLHTDPMTCGVANFSRQLSKRLGVPFYGLHEFKQGGIPLFSLKASEMDLRDVNHVMAIVESISPYYAVFWHDEGVKVISDDAQDVFYADPSLGPLGLWCPPLIQPAPKKPITLFSFGMAHKLQLHYFERVKELLDHAGIRFHLRVSVGLHEGTSLSDATSQFTQLKDRLGPENVTILGILSDEAVAEEIRDCDYVLAFFEKGVRANNTTVHAALQAGKTVVTNHDHQTPGFLKACTRDINTRTQWEPVIPYYYSWDALIEKMSELYSATVANR